MYGTNSLDQTQMERFEAVVASYVRELNPTIAWDFTGEMQKGSDIKAKAVVDGEEITVHKFGITKKFVANYNTLGDSLFDLEDRWWILNNIGTEHPRETELVNGVAALQRMGYFDGEIQPGADYFDNNFTDTSKVKELGIEGLVLSGLVDGDSGIEFTGTKFRALKPNFTVAHLTPM